MDYANVVTVENGMGITQKNSKNTTEDTDNQKKVKKGQKDTARQTNTKNGVENTKTNATKYQKSKKDIGDTTKKRLLGKKNK